MKKTIVLFFLVAFSTGSVFAQAYESRLQVSFFPPLSTNGKLAPEYTNDCSLNILVGISRNERACAFAGLANIVKNDARGALFAGLYNGVGNQVHGAAFSGLMNLSGDFTGAAFAGLINNIAGAGELRGAQFAGLFNMAGDMNGAQFAGLFNVSRHTHGAQFAGLANVSEDITGGTQWAGLFNKSGNISGSQVAGLFNVAKRVHGVQIAGLLNIAESSDYPIGLINIIRDGEMGVALAYNEIGNITATFRSGGRIFYGILGGGYNPGFDDGVIVLEGGLGARIPISNRFRINNELKSAYLGEFKSDETYHQSFSILPAFRITPKIELFAGPSLNFMYSDNPDLLNDFPSGTIWDKYGEEKIKQLHIGFSAGLYFQF